MIEIILITLLGQVLLPITLLAWLWRGTCLSRVEWLLKTLALAAYLALMLLVGIALLMPWYAAYGMVALAIPASISAWRRTVPGGPSSTGPRALQRVGAAFMLGAGCLGCLAWAAGGFLPPRGKESVSVDFPLTSGAFYVVNGGYSILINPHMKALARGELQAFRGQSYAIDIVKLNSFGLRARGLWPRELACYEIFGDPVIAPCEGRVIGMENSLPDLAPPEFDREHPAGNFVYLECGEAGIVLAHLMQSSVRVKPGDLVRRGQPLARVGNSGYSLEPHLHIHAQQKKPGPGFLSADPWVITIDGRHLLRNSRVRAAGP